MTRILQVDASRFADQELLPAVEALHAGGVVAVPSETVYGLATLANAAGETELNQLKRRQPEHPYAVAVPAFAQAAKIGDFSHLGTRKLAGRFWPGPLTIVVPRRGGDRLEQVGIRVPAHNVLSQILLLVGSPVFLTSANPTGEAAAKNAAEVSSYFDGRVAVIVDSGDATLGEASAVVSFQRNRTLVHRDGLIDKDMILRTAAFHVMMVCTGNTCRSPMAEALFCKAWAEQMGIQTDQLLEYGAATSSAGVGAVPKIRATNEAFEVLRAFSIDLSAHRSSVLDAEQVKAADLIFTMTQAHRQAVLKAVPGADDKCRLLDPAGKDIEDPIGGGLSVYKRCAERLQQIVEMRVKEIEDRRGA